MVEKSDEEDEIKELSKKDKEVVDFLKELEEDDGKKKEKKARTENIPSKPLGITLLTILFFFAGIIGVIRLFLIFWNADFILYPDYNIIVNFALLGYSLIITIFILVTGYTLLKAGNKGVRWTWYGALSISILAIINSAVSLSYVVIIFYAIIIIYLIRKPIRRYFGV